MMSWKLFAAMFLACAGLLDPRIVAAAPDSRPATQSLWDDNRYMHVSDVHRGMTGYGLTVFSGIKIERFDIDVIDVLKNFNPKYDIILISCRGEFLQHVGSVEGMSGSPIFIYPQDDTSHQHAKMAGAFAYGWPLTKDPVAGVQPIEYMLDIPENVATTQPSDEPARQSSTPTHVIRWNLHDQIKREKLPSIEEEHASLLGMRPLATPIMVSGMSIESISRIAPSFASQGLQLLQAGATSQTTDADASIPLVPGAVLAVPLLTGDMELAAIGTCTEVRGNRVFAFGHSFNNEGPVSLPMSSGRVATVIANLSASFKLGAVGPTIGTLTADQTVGVAGSLGAGPVTIPIDIHVHYDDGSLDQTYHFQEAFHPKLSADITGAAISAVLGSIKELPEHHTLDYDLTLDFAGGRAVHIHNTSVDGGPQAVFQEIKLPMDSATENPFQKVLMSRISGDIRVKSVAQDAAISSISLTKLKYNPGEKVKAFVSYRPWHQDESSLPISFDLPRDLPIGKYKVVVSDWERYFNDERTTEPFRFTAQSIDELFAAINDFEAIHHKALYIRLIRQADGVAVGRAALARLPAGARSLLLGAGRSDMTPFTTSSVKIIPTDVVMTGASEFELKIEQSAQVANSIKPHSTSQPTGN